jgi:4-diphosphocytidyl-2-C-methyl-D-erythritol kinase
MQTISLHDTLTFRHDPRSSGITLTVEGQEAIGVPADEGNLAFQAVKLLLGNRDAGLQIHLDKNIPAQAGLGGGSSDAAAALLAGNKLLCLGLPMEELSSLAAKLGSDVPFFLTGGTVLAEGRGERVTPLPPLSPHWDIVVIQPPVGISTAWAYRFLDSQRNRRSGDATTSWLQGEPIIANDFLEAALAIPAIEQAYRDLESALERTHGMTPMLCGSGSALFCRVNSRQEGQALAERLAAKHGGKVWVTTTQGKET